MTAIKIEDGEAALVIKRDGTILLSFTPVDPDNLSRPAIAVIGLSWALQDTKWRNSLITNTKLEIDARNASIITKTEENEDEV